jgi:ArsR family transcriptional regulator, lead/cadmium/zinc/bismuth-responsive transcriptional repressor
MPPSRSLQEPDTFDTCTVRCVNAKRVAAVRAAAEDPRSVADLAEMFRLLGDPTRLRIVTALAREELCVCDLATVLGASQSVVSHSLRSLRLMGIVRFRKEGRIAHYSLADRALAVLLRSGFRHAGSRTSQFRGRASA